MGLGEKRLESTDSQMLPRHRPDHNEDLRDKLAEVEQALRREATRFKGEMKVSWIFRNQFQFTTLFLPHSIQKRECLGCKEPCAHLRQSCVNIE